MLTIKQWNALPQIKRIKAVRVFYNNMSEDFKTDIAKPYHHNLNWGGEEGSYACGDWYKLLFRHCTLQSNGEVKVTVYV